ncbi:cupin domain-containing protein [Mycobacterium sp. GA-2829]|uniref:cupin domain-containing protein n=1 Tax=Mycobacterium sp. GA-2829 TaxID=1772283 RepID=UPI0012FAA60F|nr:cupin domain-containing protein [Mycobacterium sp. GA-2829]
MATTGVTLWEEGVASAGIWECAAGSSYWRLETHEVIHIVAGRMTVTPDGGSPLELKTGDVAVFPRGWSGTWDLHETIRKVFAVFA